MTDGEHAALACLSPIHHPCHFPDYAARGFRFVGAPASLSIDPSLVNYAERRGLIVLGTGDDLMTVLNAPGFVPQAF